MKVILSYGSYFNHGKKYQVKFIYDNQIEIESINDLMNKLKSTKLFNFYYVDNSGNISFKRTNTLGGTDIPKDVLHPFISMLLSLKDTKVIIGAQEFTDYNQNTISEAIDTLHINATLNKGTYFTSNSSYYIVFKYATDEQSDEVLYDFHTRLNPLAGPTSKRVTEGKEHIMPYIIDRHGDFTSKDANIIGGTNIPEDLLKEFIKSFIEELNMIITIGNQQFKETFDEEKFNEAISQIEPGRTKSRQKVTV